ncbi:MAG: HlyC/CorC family transporter [Spirochaetes bacterium]|nr:MAG: HlyC/CorC family transporter [Spirochaetota bacterium]
MNHTTIDYLVIVFSLALSAFFNSSESALFSLKSSHLLKFASSPHAREKLVGEVMNRPEKILITILLGNLLVSFAASTVATRLLLEVYGDVGHFIAIAVVTPVVIILCEVMPKTFSIADPVYFARLVISPLNFFNRLFYPVREALLALVNVFIRLFSLKTDSSGLITEDELDAALLMGEHGGLIGKEEGIFIKNVLRFSKKEAQNVMTPRNQAVFVPYGASVEKAAEIFLKSGLVRAAVFKKDLDDIVGVLDSRTLIPYRWGFKKAQNINRMLYTMHHYPATKELGELLVEFLNKSIQIAIVVDEYGGTAGVVTLSGILSELMGREFSDWDDPGRPEVRRITGDRAVIEGDMQIDDFNHAFGEDLSSSESETMAGFMIERLEHFPGKDEVVRTQKHVLRVKRTANNRIVSIEVMRGDEHR